MARESRDIKVSMHNYIVTRSVAIQNCTCNSPSPLLVNIVRFGPLRITISPHGFKMRLLRRGFHTLIRNASFASPTDVGSHNPSTLEAQRPRWHTARCLALIPFVTVGLGSYKWYQSQTPNGVQARILGP